jgi:hypothetical protein
MVEKVGGWPLPLESHHNVPMATSAQIRQQLVEALELDLIGPGWDNVARRHERLPQPPSIWYTTGFLVCRPRNSRT